MLGSNNKLENKIIYWKHRKLIISNIRGTFNKFPDFFRMGTFIDSTHMKV